MRSEVAEYWLKGMYLYTALGAGGMGLLMLLQPKWFAAQLKMPPPEPVVFGIVASSYLAFGLLALLGLRAPQRFLPLLLLQLTYKSLWLLVVFVPLLLGGQATPYAWLFAAVFVSYVVGDLLVLPLRDLLAVHSEDEC